MRRWGSFHFKLDNKHYFLWKIKGFDALLQLMNLGGKTLKEGDWISLNGTTGEVIEGKQALDPPAMTPDLDAFMSWVDAERKIKVTIFSISLCFHH